MKKPVKKAVKKTAKKKAPALIATYTDIKTFEHACSVMKYNPKALPIVKHLAKSERKATIDAYKLRVIVAAMNKLTRFKADYTNSNQYKYYPWAWIKPDKSAPSGFAFDDTFTYCDYTYAIVGPRLSVSSGDEARYLIKQFADLYKGMWF